MKKQTFILSLLITGLAFAQEDKKDKVSEEKKIEEVTIRKTKKAIEQKADRTVFDFSEQPQLNTGTALEGIKKLPGLMSSELTGMAYQGKQLSVFMDGRPLNISSTELNAFLEGLPANSIEKIEVITNPGAEYPATNSGAILNIITSKSAKSYLTATYSGNYSFSHYDRYRNKTNQSILLNSKNKWFGWQLNAGVNYNENINTASLGGISESTHDGIRKGYFTKAALFFDVGQDRVLLNYNIYYNDNKENVLASGLLSGIPYDREDNTVQNGVRHVAAAKYQKRFDNSDKKLDFDLSYTKIDNDFRQNNLYNKLNSTLVGVSPSENSSDARFIEFKVNYTQDIPILDKGTFNIGGLYEHLDYNTLGNNIRTLDYQRQTASSFVELKASKKKWDFILGLRAEGYDIGGETYNRLMQKHEDLIAFRKYKIFPNASVQYNFSRMVNVAFNYNKKIQLPNISMLNPNANYNNPNFIQSGNAHLQPTIYDNFQVKFSAFNYFFLNYSMTHNTNAVLDNAIRKGDQIAKVRENVPTSKSHNVTFGFPVPLDVFKTSFKKLLSSNPDKMNFIYFVGSYQYNQFNNISGGLWYFNANGQFVLPEDIKLNANYTIIPKGSEYFYYKIEDHLNHSLDITLSKKFLKNRLSVSLFANDVFNTNRVSIGVIGQNPEIPVRVKINSRSFGISVNYKIPTKNKLAKENSNLLLENKKEEEEGGLIKK